MTEPRILEPQCEWTSADVGDEAVWTVQLTDAELEELDTSLRRALERSDDVLELDRNDFPLPTLSTRLAEIERELIDGRGFVRIRGIDRSAYGQDEMEPLSWGIGTHLGSTWAQNKQGHEHCDTRHQGRAVNVTDAKAHAN